MLIDITSAEALAIRDAIANYENQTHFDLHRNIGHEECDECGASRGDACEADCNRAAYETHHARLQGLLRKIGV